jgi:iron complex transport system ATP-binding protein
VNTAIDLSSVSVHAGRRPLLEIDRLRLDRGGILGLMGPNGAGKTTALQVMLGMLRPSGGRVEILGRELSHLSGTRRTRLRSRIGHVGQRLPGHSEMPLTVREVVAIGRTARAGLFRSLAREDWQVVDQWIERLGLEHLALRGFGEISGGEQRKTMIARAMAQQPELLLLDEPTANLDLGWREVIVDTIETLYCQGEMAVVLVCHELEVLPPSCSEIVLLQHGKVAATGSPVEVFDSARVRSLFGPGLEVIHHGGRHATVPREAAGRTGKRDD